MGETTAISWCDHTFNPWMGCTKVSPACDGCYAENLMDTRYKRVRWGAPGKGTGDRVRTSPANWKEPLRWNRRAIVAGTRPFVFGGSLLDPFDNRAEESWRMEYFNLIAATPQLVWLLLTKRPQNIVDMAEDAGGLPPNVALGTTAEDQTRWDINIPALLAAKAETRPLFAFASCGPLLGRIDPTKAPVTTAMRRQRGCTTHTFFDPIHPRQDPRFKLDWIITEGETDQGKHKARPSHPNWFRTIRDACAASGTAYHHKQNGEWVSVSEVEGEGPHHTFPDGATVRRIGARHSGRTIDGAVYDGRPQVRELCHANRTALDTAREALEMAAQEITHLPRTAEEDSEEAREFFAKGDAILVNEGDFWNSIAAASYAREALSALSAIEAEAVPDGFIRDYVEGYEFRLGNGGGYTPSDAEKAMLEDFANGLLSDLPTHPAPVAEAAGVKAPANSDEFVERFFGLMDPPLTEREKTVAAMAMGYAVGAQLVPAPATVDAAGIDRALASWFDEMPPIEEVEAIGGYQGVRLSELRNRMLATIQAALAKP